MKRQVEKKRRTRTKKVIEVIANIESNEERIIYENVEKKMTSFKEKDNECKEKAKECKENKNLERRKKGMYRSGEYKEEDQRTNKGRETTNNPWLNKK